MIQKNNINHQVFRHRFNQQLAHNNNNILLHNRHNTNPLYNNFLNKLLFLVHMMEILTSLIFLYSILIININKLLIKKKVTLNSVNNKQIKLN